MMSSPPRRHVGVFAAKRINSFTLLIPLALFLGTLILRLPTFYKYFEFAYEGQLAFFGREALAGGGFYATPWSMKPPGESLTYGLLYVFFGSGNWALSVRIVLAFLSALATLFIYLLGKKLFGGWAGLTAALFFSIFFSRADVFNGDLAYAEMLMPFFTILGYYLFFISRDNKNRLILFFAGLSLGISLLYKQSALYDFLPLLLFSVGNNFLAWKKKPNLKSIFFSHLPLILGFVLPMMIFVLYIFLIGRISFFWEWTIRKPLLYSKLREKYPFPYILTILKKTYPVFMLAFLAALTSLFRRDPKRLLFALWLFFTPLTFITSGKFWDYYFIQLFLPVCFLAGIFIEDLWLWGKKWTTNTFLLRTAFLLGIILLLVPLNKKPYQASFNHYLSFLRKEISRTDYMLSLFDGVYRFEAAECLKQNLGLQETLFVMEGTPGLYVLTDKVPPYKEFLFEQQFFENKAIGFTFMHSFETYEANRRKLMEKLQSAPPDFIALVTSSPDIVSVQFKEFPQFFSFVFKNYDLVKNVRDIWIYKLEKEKVTMPQELVVDFEFVKKYFLVSDSSGEKIILEPLAGEARSFEVTLAEKNVTPPISSPLEVRFLEPDGRDSVGYAFEKPSGIIDLHLQIPKQPKPIKLIRIKKGNTLWIYPQNGFNALIKVVEEANILNLYFDPFPPREREGKYRVFVIYQDDSISKAEINVKAKDKQ